MLEIQTTCHLDGATYVRFTLNAKTGEAWLQLPCSQMSRHRIELDGVELEEGGGRHQWILDGMMVELRQLYPDATVRYLFYAGCDVDNIVGVSERWEDGWRKYVVEFKDGSTEKYEEVPGDIDEDDFYFVKEE